MNRLPISENVYEAAERVIVNGGIVLTKKRLRLAINAAVDEMSRERHIESVPPEETQEDALTKESSES